MEMKTSMHRILNLNTLCLLFIALAIITRIAIYIHNPNFWLDEALLAQSTFVTSLKEILLADLPANQAAPLGFILSVKALSFCFGYSEYVLRIIPLLAGILIFPLAYSFAIREFNKKFACIFLFFLTISTPLLFYNIQFKQYATEILVSLTYLNAFCLNRKTIIEDAKIPLSFVLIVPVGMLFSNSSIFVLVGFFFFALFEQWRIKQIKLFLLNNWLKIFIIAAFLLCYYLLWLSQIESVKNGFMDDCWKEGYLRTGDAALLLPLLLQSALGYFIDISSNIYLNCALFTCLFFFGSVFLYKEKQYLFFAIVTGIILYFVAYFLGKVPLVVHNISAPWKVIGSRFFVHFFPIVLIVPSYAIFKLLESEKYKKLAFLVLIIMPCFAFYVSYKHIASGLELYRISELLETVEDESSAIVMRHETMISYFYYQFLNGKNSGEIYLLSKPHSRDILKFPEYSLILIKSGLPFSNIIEELKNNGKKRAYFIFPYLHTYSYAYLFAAVNTFPPEKISIYKSYGVTAILLELE
jgi:hypothetical protein